ncbi:unnamed protein product [Urochloa decumbens]|uniref:Cullin N-terminal domain-containing protein n=1 Tax=Urochloa decumbens TaxID=240449 RepID=A0ABC9GC15_9POAL
MAVAFEDAWQFLAAGLAKIRRAVDGDGESLSSNEYMALYTLVYNIAPHDCSDLLYQRYKEDTENYIKSTVLPPLMEMQGELLLRELVDTWRKHKRIVKFQAKTFGYLDRYYIVRRSLPSLRIVSLASFQDMVFNKIKSRVTATVIGMIDDERDGKCIDRDLLKNVLDVFVQIGHSIDYYGSRVIEDFEQIFFKGTRNYYSRKAHTWNMEYSDHDYMLKVEECLQKEKERVEHYMHSSTVPKLMEVVRSVLITRHAELKEEMSGGLEEKQLN